MDEARPNADGINAVAIGKRNIRHAHRTAQRTHNIYGLHSTNKTHTQGHKTLRRFRTTRIQRSIGPFPRPRWVAKDSHTEHLAIHAHDPVESGVVRCSVAGYGVLAGPLWPITRLSLRCSYTYVRLSCTASNRCCPSTCRRRSGQPMLLLLARVKSRPQPRQSGSARSR